MAHNPPLTSSVDRNTRISTREMHSAGEPLRIIESGYPPILGRTLLEKRRYAREHLDHLRRFLMFEPRGHYDMYGAVLVEPDHLEADIAVLFLQNEGYSPMCGHAVIALGRYAVDQRLVKVDELVGDEGAGGGIGEVPVNIQCPCGLVRAFVQYNDGQTGRVRFHSVPAFAFALDVEIEVADIGKIKVDIGYGGAFYALVPDFVLHVDVKQSKTTDLVRVASAVSDAVRSKVKLSHPESEDLAYLYGTIITDGKDAYCSEPTANLTVFANAEVDRAPTGSGVTARVAVQFARGQIRLNEVREFESAANNSRYTGRVVTQTNFGEFRAVIVEVGGTAFYTGTATFTAEDKDDLRHGFLLN